MDEDAARWRTLAVTAQERIDGHRLQAMIHELLDVDGSVATEIAASSTWGPGSRPGTSCSSKATPRTPAFLLVSGRLDVFQSGELVREIAAGEIVGRSRADRAGFPIGDRRGPGDDALARFDVEAFRTLTTVYPALMLQVSRTVLGRLGRPNACARSRRLGRRSRSSRRWTPRMCVTRLANELSRHGTTAPPVGGQQVDAALGPSRSRRLRARLHPAGVVRVPPGRRDRQRLPPAGDGSRGDPVDKVSGPRWPTASSSWYQARPGRGRAAPGGGRADRRAEQCARRAVVGALAPRRCRASDGVGGGRRPPHGSTGSPTFVRGPVRTSPGLPASSPGTAPGSCSAAVALAASPTSAPGGRFNELGVEIDAIGGASIGTPMGR